MLHGTTVALAAATSTASRQRGGCHARGRGGCHARGSPTRGDAYYNADVLEELQTKTQKRQECQKTAINLRSGGVPKQSAASGDPPELSSSSSQQSAAVERVGSLRQLALATLPRFVVKVDGEVRFRLPVAAAGRKTPDVGGGGAARDDSERPTPPRLRSSSSESTPVSNGAGQQKGECDRMGGTSLPDVVRQLLRDPSILKWHPCETVYEVMDGDNFGKR